MPLWDWGRYAQFYARGHNVFKEEALIRTGIYVEVRQVKHFDAIPARCLWRRQWIRFWFGKPAGEVQRGRRWDRTGLRDEVQANQLKQREYRQRPSNIKCSDSRIVAHT
jgi:hypothetical protein